MWAGLPQERISYWKFLHPVPQNTGDLNVGKHTAETSGICFSPCLTVINVIEKEGDFGWLTVQI